MSMLNPIMLLQGKRKEIFDRVFRGYVETSLDITREKVADLLLKYDENRLEELEQEVFNSNDPIELLKSKAQDKPLMDLPSINIQV